MNERVQIFINYFRQSCADHRVGVPQDGVMIKALQTAFEDRLTLNAFLRSVSTNDTDYTSFFTPTLFVREKPLKAAELNSMVLYMAYVDLIANGPRVW